MSDQFQDLGIPFCSIHNQPGVVINPDKNDKQQLDNQQKFQDIQNKNTRKINMLNPFKLQINEFQNKITQSLNKIIILISDQIEQIKSNQEKQNELFIESNQKSMNLILQINEQQTQSFQDFGQQVTLQLHKIKQNFNIDFLIQGWQLDEQVQQIKDDNNKFQYSKVLNSIQQNDFCYAIATNLNISLVAAGFYNKIKILELKNDNLKLNSILEGHSKAIKQLIFLKKSQQLISACSEGKIIIWDQSSQVKWQQIQILNEHNDGVNCLQINSNEDLIISGSADKTIKFWVFDSNWKCDQTLIMEDKLISLSLNDSNNRLITQNLNIIIIIEKQGNQWQKTQAIQTTNQIYRLCFTNDDQFAVQLLLSDKLQIYNNDKKDYQFILGQEVNVKSGKEDCISFPMQYVKSKGILVDKNCQYLNILRLKQNGEFVLDQSIDFGLSVLYGCVSDEGLFILTWDRSSYQIQIRKLEII